jgi:Sigma-70 region 2
LADNATDERLLEQAANGNTAAFQILYERYRDPIFRFAYRLLGSVEAAEDVAHDCFLSLIKEPGFAADLPLCGGAESGGETVPKLRSRDSDR